MNRLLGVSEHIRWLLDQRWSFNFALTARVRGTIAIPQLTNALAWVQRRHPLLAVKIAVNEHQQPRFVSEGVPPIPLRVVQRQGDHHWCQETEAELSLPFSYSTEPLLRVVFLQGEAVSELIFTCYHSICDGLSTIYLIRDILQEISTPGSTREILPELPCWEELIPLSKKDSISGNAIATAAPTHKINPSNAGVDLNRVSDRKQIKKSQGSRILHWSLSTEETVTNAGIDLNRVSDKKQIKKSQGSSILHWCLSPEETATFVSRCRENQTSVQGALCTAFLLSIGEQMNYPEDTVHKCLSPCNIRKYLVPEIGEDFGLYICGLLTAHTLKPEINFWDLAREIKHQLNEWTAGKLFEDIPRTKAFLSTKPDPQMVYDQMDNNIKLVVTNLGRLNIPQNYGSLFLEAIYGPTVQSSENAKTVGVITLGDRMFLTLTFSESVLPRSLAKKIQIGAMRQLSEALETPSQAFDRAGLGIA
ncbi:hypothetical protein QUA20_25015 [Microcoleus sp. Pol7_A1]|uniref:phthiocerol/phthiodiolone dimycocerosyl transferase family protein n=1 Tax=Microcoleus sp. Pol7_A1 TaxID=2818893 RepID=UPI002FCFF422